MSELKLKHKKILWVLADYMNGLTLPEIAGKVDVPVYNSDMRDLEKLGYTSRKKAERPNPHIHTITRKGLIESRHLVAGKKSEPEVVEDTPDPGGEANKAEGSLSDHSFVGLQRSDKHDSAEHANPYTPQSSLTESTYADTARSFLVPAEENKLNNEGDKEMEVDNKTNDEVLKGLQVKIETLQKTIESVLQVQQIISKTINKPSQSEMGLYGRFDRLEEQQRINSRLMLDEIQRVHKAVLYNSDVMVSDMSAVKGGLKTLNDALPAIKHFQDAVKSKDEVIGEREPLFSFNKGSGEIGVGGTYNIEVWLDFTIVQDGSLKISGYFRSKTASANPSSGDVDLLFTEQALNFLNGFKLGNSNTVKVISVGHEIQGSDLTRNSYPQQPVQGQWHQPQQVMWDQFGRPIARTRTPSEFGMQSDTLPVTLEFTEPSGLSYLAKFNITTVKAVDKPNEGCKISLSLVNIEPSS
ncbi:MAG: hypothetical protein IBX57_00720 [Gammaproteobacteria bacterium]|nr:hypothetical protein [Gammaproteobacteria bacterium]